jgi:NAD+ synthase (glutamine-hydrolysing)
VAVFCKGGKPLALVPKTYLPNYQEFYEARHFMPAPEKPVTVSVAGYDNCAFGSNILLCCENVKELRIAGEICEDLWVPESPSIRHALEGATIICNPSASDEIATKPAYRKNLVAMQSAKLVSGYIYADAGNDESTQDLVYSGHSMIAENGTVLGEAKLFSHDLVVSELDVQRLAAERRKSNTYHNLAGGQNETPYLQVSFTYEESETELTRAIVKTPFVPSNELKKKQRCEEILTLQAMGLRKRLAHTGCKTAVIGLSGGLDSTLALLVTVKAYDLLGMDHKDIVAVTMPGFGTTDRTYQNALDLAKSLGATLKEISIVDAVRQHFKDIEQDENVHDITYENGQARERTQILMDIANKMGGMVIGTGDMSEMALGWATYNGDHMSMYAVNVSIPKTLVRYLVSYYADETDKKTAAVLKDILDTPVSPELLPPENGEIAQKTEDIVGPYELHDFFLYYMLRFGYPPAKIFRLCKIAFRGEYTDEVMIKWMETFYRRFFSQQFKRSCVPDGPKVGTVSLSPRGDLRMPSDASGALWLKEIENLKKM